MDVYSNLSIPRTGELGKYDKKEILWKENSRSCEWAKRIWGEWFLEHLY